MSGPPAGAVHPVRVFSAGSLTEAQLAVAFLQGSGIPARIEDACIAEALGDAAKGFTKGGGIAVVVPSNREVDAAKAVVRFRTPAPFDDEDFGRPGDGESE